VDEVVAIDLVDLVVAMPDPAAGLDPGVAEVEHLLYWSTVMWPHVLAAEAEAGVVLIIDLDTRPARRLLQVDPQWVEIVPATVVVAAEVEADSAPEMAESTDMMVGAAA
jgi:aminoglycoside/choline kinase family phosphotransferase